MYSIALDQYIFSLLIVIMYKKCSWYKTVIQPLFGKLYFTFSHIKWQHCFFVCFCVFCLLQEAGSSYYESPWNAHWPNNIIRTLFIWWMMPVLKYIAQHQYWLKWKLHENHVYLQNISKWSYQVIKSILKCGIKLLIPYTCEVWEWILYFISPNTGQLWKFHKKYILPIYWKTLI